MTEYKDVGTIGSGGFGIVVRCVREQDGGTFAKKILLASDDDAIKRFQREVRILARLDHPRIIKVVDAHLDDSPYWYVMPLYRHSLRDLILEVAGDRRRVATIYSGILEGMQYAHEQGVIHRDLKPENILLNSEPDLVISDFGLGRALDAQTSRATTSGDWVGTFGYMAPEQLEHAKHADFRSDIFSLGRLLYVMYTGESPSAVQELSRLPVGIAKIVERCTKSDPMQRFQSVKELQDAFNLLGIERRKVTAEEELRELVGVVVAQSHADAAQVKRISDLIGQCHEDSMLLHDVAVKMPANVIAALYQAYPEVARVLVNQFATVAASQGWPFAYTDEIAAACQRFARAIPDAEIKAQLAATALEVGASHNRYYVMDVAAGLIASATEARDALAVANALEPVKGRLWAVRDRLKVSELHPALREVFDTAEES